MLLVLVPFVAQHAVGISAFCCSTCCCVVWLNMLLVLVCVMVQHSVGIGVCYGSTHCWCCLNTMAVESQLCL